MDDVGDTRLVRGGEDGSFERAGQRGGTQEVNLRDPTDPLWGEGLGQEVCASVVDEEIEPRALAGDVPGEGTDALV